MNQVLVQIDKFHEYWNAYLNYDNSSYVILTVMREIY